MIPANHPDRAVCLSNLAIALQIRSWRSDSRLDLDEAIEACREAAAVTPDDNIHYLAFVSNLASTLVAGYQQSGSLPYLDQAIEASRRVVKITPADHSSRSVPLTNLGTALLTRHDRSGSLSDLDEAVDILIQAADSIPAGRVRHAGALAAVGNALLIRYERSGSVDDLDNATEAIQQAIRATPEDDTSRPARLSSLGNALIARYQRSKSPTDLNQAILLCREALDAASADDIDRASYLLYLCQALTVRNGRSEPVSDLDQAIELARQAEAITMAAPDIRVHAAIRWGALAATAGKWSDAATAYSSAVRRLGQVAPRSLLRHDQEHALGILAGRASDAAACCIRAGDADRAVELLEQGRAILLGQTLETRTDVTDLAEQHPRLAERFSTLRDTLDEASLSIAPPLMLGDNLADTAGFSSPAWLAAQRRRTAVEAFDQVISEIRELPGFSGFLQPMPIPDLAAAACDGPVVIVNVSLFGSHALILSAGEVLDPVPLSQVTPARVNEAAEQVASIGASPYPTGMDEQLDAILGWLWDAIAEPVLDRLGRTEPVADGEPWPRLWWCLPGVMSFLPVHAAGYHDTRTLPRPKTVLDRVVSSCTPTVRSLIHSQRAGPDGRQTAGIRAVVVAMPHTPAAADLPGAEAEARRLRQLLDDRVLTLAGPHATRDAVVAALPRARWAHLACHGIASAGSPSDSCLLLANSDRLAVTDIARLRLHDADLAFLSACSTAWPGTQLPDEAIHMASAFQLAGYRQVVGTLWPVIDRIAFRVAGEIYADLTREPTRADAARALHNAIRSLRDQRPRNPVSWASHIHIGA